MVDPQTFKGTRDISGEDILFKNHVIDKIRKVFESFGFEPLETPVMERLETLHGKYGDEGESLLFRLGQPHDDGGLRYDHTVPLARFAAMQGQNLVLPYRRYAIGPVFRAENPQKGRFRQFTQVDFDTIGSSSLSVDAEIVAINTKVLESLGFTNQYVVLANTRKLLNAMVEEMSVANEAQKNIVFRAWDKLDKKSLEDVVMYVKEEAEKIKDPNLPKVFEETTKEVLDLSQKSNIEIIDELSELFRSEKSHEAIQELKMLVNFVLSMNVSPEKMQINPLLARGLSYYTGPIFETVVREENIGIITGGGRYDHLIHTLGGPELPASGSSFGLERLLTVIEDLGLKAPSMQTTQIFMPVFDNENIDLMKETFQIGSLLRENGINVEIYLGNAVKLGKQFQIADRKKIPYVVLLGPEELQNNTVKVKDIRSAEGQEIEVKKDTLVKLIKTKLL
jgi:histidyl-tRNA synthetase